ncbi:MDR family MFS transporter [Streptomyces sp. NPDC056149]|uniref:MDR family MFS transporter n=1 Tax=unclassified Streptomyces TaxID=2593676 RepID=UPI00238170C7|nr:MDR family MFS transporter [Streptomyces sp. WZ-12]
MTFSETQQQGAAGDAPARLTHRQITTVMSGLALSMFLGALDQTVVASALRTIADDLHGLTAQAWVTTAYLITGTLATPLYGKLSDIHGRRPVYLVAIGLFTVGSLLCGAAGSIYELAAFRAVQGLGGGGLISLAMTIVADITTPRERGRYQGYFMAVFGGASIVGPLVGGAFADRASIFGVDGWRWIFLINVPLAAAAAVALVRVLRFPHRRVRHRLDYLGALTLAVGLVPLLTVAEQGRAWGWGSPQALLAYAIGAVGLTAFVVVERRMGEAALLPQRLFRIRTFRIGVGLNFVFGIGMFGAMTTLPLYLQLIRGMSPMGAGLATLPTVAANLVVTLLVGRLVARTGRFKLPLVAGFASLAAALLVFATLRVDSPLWHAMVGMALMGAGLGAAMQNLTALSQSEIPRTEMGSATATINFFRSNGGTVGTAAFLSLLFATAAGQITDRLATAGHDAGFRHLLSQPGNAHALVGVLRPGGGVNLEDSAFLHTLDPGAALPFLEGYVASMRIVFLAGAAVTLAAFLLALWRVPNSTLSDE